MKRKLYHPNNAQLGLAIMRTGVIHWHAGQIEEGHGLICKAYRILLVTHGPNHAITRDLEVCHMELPKILMFCSYMSAKPSVGMVYRANWLTLLQKQG